jgi:hypothetical protein
MIHVFCDASERAFEAVLYVRSSTREGIIVGLACSKNRLAPVKKITLPRRELLAALEGARLLQYFCRQTGSNIRDATLRTDTMVALKWIKVIPEDGKDSLVTGSRKYKHTMPTQWKHCPGVDNPALTAFSEMEVGQNTKSKRRGTERTNEQLASPRTEATTSKNQTWLVRAIENVTVNPRCRQTEAD